jgi:hypothetical protein
LPVTTPARTLVDLSGETSRARLTAALEEAHYDKLVGYLNVGSALVRLGEPGRRGSVLLGELLDERTGGRELEQSALERLLSELFEAAGMTGVIRQNPLPSKGELRGLVDGFIPRGALIAEGDGRRWHGPLRRHGAGPGARPGRPPRWVSKPCGSCTSSSPPTWRGAPPGYGAPLNCGRARGLASDAFDDDGGCHASASAHGDQAGLQIAPLQLIEHRANQDRAGCTDWVAEGHGATR